MSDAGERADTGPRAMPPIRLGQHGDGGEGREAGRWRLILIITSRLVAVLWLVFGLAQWHSVLTTPNDGPEAFDELSTGAVAAVAFFAVADPVAAVGLWLGTLWGGVIWGVTILAQIAVVIFVPGFFNAGPALILVDVVLAGFYVFAALAAHQEAARGDF